MVRRLGIIVQAHMSSSRLPNKMMLDLCGKSVIGHVITRLKKVKNADELIVATSELPVDDVLVRECKRYGVNVFRGSNDDVLARFYHAAKEFRITDIVRICADNTCVDWNLLERQIEKYKSLSNTIVVPGENVPLGLGGELFTYEMLEDAYYNGCQNYHREHVTPYIYEKNYNIVKVDYENDYSNYRLTLDTIDDWHLIEKIYKELYDENDNDDDITIDQITNLLKNNPLLQSINSHVRQKKVK